MYSPAWNTVKERRQFKELIDHTISVDLYEADSRSLKVIAHNRFVSSAEFVGQYAWKSDKREGKVLLSVDYPDHELVDAEDRPIMVESNETNTKIKKYSIRDVFSVNCSINCRLRKRWMIVCFLAIISILKSYLFAHTPYINMSSGAVVSSDNEAIHSIAFLFLVSKPLNEEMWERWFQNATDHRRYSIFVHYGKPGILVKSEQQKNQKNSTDGSNDGTDRIITSIIPDLGKFFCQYLIPSVPTAWYWLYDAQMQLLQYAFERDPHATQFVYVSDTSIPLISFNEMYDRLIFGKYEQRRGNVSEEDQQISEAHDTSRFCLTEHREITMKAWQYPSQALNISMNDVRKAEMWSIITRHDVSILLTERSTLDLWNQTFYSEWTRNGRKNVGAPDETLFPTLLNMKSSSGLCNMEVDCKQGFRQCCCSTKVVWRTGNSKITVHDHDTNQDIELSNTCSGSPCLFENSFFEEGLIALQKTGHFFLRKVMTLKGTPVVVRTKRNESISLNDALVQLHQNQPMMIIARNISSSSRDNGVDSVSHQNMHFQCIISQ